MSRDGGASLMWIGTSSGLNWCITSGTYEYFIHPSCGCPLGNFCVQPDVSLLAHIGGEPASGQHGLYPSQPCRSDPNTWSRSDA